LKTQEKNRYKLIRTKSPKKSWNGLPAFIKRSDVASSLSNNFFPSIVWHIIFFLLLWGVFTILTIGKNPILKTKEKMQDIKFVLNNSSSHRPRYSKSNSSAKAVGNNKSSAIEKKINIPKNIKRNNFGSIPVAAPDDFSIPVPKTKPMSGSGGLGKSTSSASGTSSSNSASTDIGAENGTSSGSGLAKGTGFDKNATRKAVSSYDISPYVNELKRNIRLNWRTPQDNKSVELFLRIARDGRLIILNVKRTSEVAEVDNVALNAVRKTLPLNPLPSKFNKSYLDVIFTFDSSAVGSRY